MIRSIGALSPQTLNGTQFNFESWSDGGAGAHEITIPTSNTTFTAAFSSSGGGAPLPNGVYRTLPTHIPGGSTAQCADVSGASGASGADVIQCNCHTGNNQRWQFTQIRPMHATSMCLAVFGNSATNDADVVQATRNNAAGQRWLLRSVASGVFELLAQTGTNRCLDVLGVSTADGADIIQWACNGGANQRFRIVP